MCTCPPFLARLLGRPSRWVATMIHHRGKHLYWEPGQAEGRTRYDECDLSFVRMSWELKGRRRGSRPRELRPSCDRCVARARGQTSVALVFPTHVSPSACSVHAWRMPSAHLGFRHSTERTTFRNCCRWVAV
ncbi:hypothetical protein NDU88_005983 [Pleurodeles waltl]|uniref:Uncharacterized protein n=1 Tax=Pleurodeles waltl TaxID=8319 RepID=A0AAV7MZK5_PLEWA|nr:hypothetical protein NDU88_005983 [Pleurodeles waltl]